MDVVVSQSEKNSALVVCLSCFGLWGRYEGKEHRCSCQPDDRQWQKEVWGGYDIAALVDLCHLCARAVVKSGSRWSWYGCETCRQVNTRWGRTRGLTGGVLPLGRHSLMNAVSLRGDAADDEVEGFIATVNRLIDCWKALGRWVEMEGRRMAVTVGWSPSDQCGVPLNEWLATFPASTRASVDSIRRFARGWMADSIG